MNFPTLPANHWLHAGMYVLDTETTGTDPETARIASISGGRLDPRFASPCIATEYIGVDMPEEAGKVNGLTSEFLAEHASPDPASTIGFFAASVAAHLGMGMPVVIANAPYDLTVLDRECRRYGVSTVSQRLASTSGGHPSAIAPVVDPIVLDKRAVKYRRRVSPDQGARCLKTICQVHGAGWDDDAAHTSEYDAVQAGRAVWRIVTKFDVLSRMSLAELHTAQVGWYAEQAEGLRAWFASEAVKREQWAAVGPDRRDQESMLAEAAEWREKAASVDTAWPIRPYVPTAGDADPGFVVTASDVDRVTDPAGAPLRVATSFDNGPAVDLDALNRDIEAGVDPVDSLCKLVDCGCAGVAHA